MGTLPMAPTKTGYTFTGWNTAADGSGSAFTATTTVTGNTTLYAKWTIKQYTLTYTAGSNGSITGTKTQTVNHGASGSAVTAVPNTGYHFVKWSDGSTANPRTDTNVTGDISVTAEFAINTYTVTFDKNGGDTEANPQTKTVTHGGNVGTLLTAPTKTGCTFTGWNTQVNGSGDEFTEDTPVTGNITVYAQWVVNVTGVSLNKSSITLAVGASETLVATVSPSNATNKNVTWSSSNTNVATVNSSGTVTAKAAGTATITVKTVDGGKTATCTVSVPYVMGASWTVGPDTPLTRLGDAVGKTPGADFDNIYPWSEMTTLTQNGQTVVKIPKFYYKRTYDGTKHEFWITNTPLPEFKLHPVFLRNGVEKPYIFVGVGKFSDPGGYTSWQWCRQTAQSYGTGWDLMDIQTWSAIQILWLVEYADTNSQKFSANYRGINGLWTNPGQYLNGIYIRSGSVYVAGTNTGLIVDYGDFIKNWQYSSDYDWLFIPSAYNPDYPTHFYTYIPDIFNHAKQYSTPQVVHVGFDYYCTLSNESAQYEAGLFKMGAVYEERNGIKNLGGRAQYIP